MRNPIDVIVVAGHARAGLAACMESVEAHGGFDRLIVVDDGPGDPDVRAVVRARSRRHLLLCTGRRLGMAAAANRAIGFSRNDVVLLDAQAVVCAGWLDRIARCAATDTTIGVTSPFTNAGGHCVFPFAGGDFPLPADPGLVDRAMASSGGPFHPDIPAGTEVCLFVRQQLVREIGGFDETIASARAAINAFCRRARDAGWRTVLCDDTFVGSRAAPAASGRGAANGDPLNALRGLIRSRLAVLAQPGKPGVLHVLHDRGGGTEKYVKELITALHDDARHFFLRILPDRWRLTDLHGELPADYDYRWRFEDDGAAVARYDLPRAAADAPAGFAALCEFLRIRLVHVHSAVGSGDDLAELLSAAALPYFYTAHDMYLPCPTVYLIDSEGAYCNATTDPGACGRCLAKFDAWKDVDIVGWRRRNTNVVRGASRVFAPSQWAAGTLAKYFPGVAVTVAPPWPEPTAMPPPATGAPDGFALPVDDHRHIGVLGAIGPEKGARHVDALVRRIRERNLPLRLVVVGYLDREHRGQSPDQVLTIHGPYADPEVRALFDYYRIGVALFPTIWPETFGYTLSEAWAAARPALVPPGGALEERVSAIGAGWVMTGWPDADRVLDQLMDITAPERRDDLERRARLAASAQHKETGGRARIIDAYRGLLLVSAARSEPGAPGAAVVEAACRACGVASILRS